MKVNEFFFQLKVLSKDYLQYHVYSTDFSDTTIDLHKNQNTTIEGQIMHVAEMILDQVEDSICEEYHLKDGDELLISLPEIIEVIMIVQTNFMSVLGKVEEKCDDPDQCDAVYKVKMINDDIFNKIPQLAGEVYYGG